MMGRAWRRNCIGVGGLGVGGLVLVVFIQLSTVGVPAAEGGDSPGASPCWDSPSAEGCEDANVFCERPPRTFIRALQGNGT